MGATSRQFRILVLAACVPLAQCLHDDDGDTPASRLAVVDAYPNLAFTDPVVFAQAPGDPARAFVVAQRGVVHVFEHRPDAAASSVFLDIDARVTDTGGEMGLLGLA